jgi:hypothetical protein
MFDCITLSKIIRKIFVPEVQVVVKFKVSSVDPALEVALCELHCRRIDGGHRESPVMRAVAESNRVPKKVNVKFSRREVKYRSKVCCIAMLKENEAYQSGMNVFSCSLRWPTFSMKKKGGREGRRAEEGGK